MDDLVATVLFVGRVLLVVVFLAASRAKLLDRPGAAQGAADLGVPARFTQLVAVALPAVEFLTALLLIIPATVKVGAAFGAMLLVVFTVAIVRVLRAGRRPMCFCFGSKRAQPVSRDTVVRNVALTAIAVALLFGSN